MALGTTTSAVLIAAAAGAGYQVSQSNECTSCFSGLLRQVQGSRSAPVVQTSVASVIPAKDASNGTSGLNDELNTSSRIAELEARVSASLRAAYERSARIKELEDTVEEGLAREERIAKLEEVLHETLEEAELRAERIEELEAELERRGGAPDLVAAAILDEAMAYANKLMEEQEDLVVDAECTMELREAVEAVQKVKPAVDAHVAELISKLVTALKWPLVLRDRLADAEEIIHEQQEIQARTEQELKELQKSCDTYQSELKERQIADEEAATTLKLKEVAHEEELRQLRERQDESEAKRLEAELKAKELRELLDFADQAAQEAVDRQRRELEEVHSEELKALRHLAEVAQSQQKDAQARASELQEYLKAAEAAIDDEAKLEKDKLSAKHAEEVFALKRQFEDAVLQREAATSNAEQLKKKLEASKEDDAQNEAIAEELRQLRQNREATDRLRKESEEQLQELRAMLKASRATSEADEARHALEVRGLTSRVASAEVQAEIATFEARELKDRLLSEAKKAEIASQKAIAADSYQTQLESARQEQELAEAKQKEADARASDLAERLAALEKEFLIAEQKQQQSLDASKEEQLQRFKQEALAAEAKAQKVEASAQELRDRLAKAETTFGEDIERKKQFIESEHVRVIEATPQSRKERLRANLPQSTSNSSVNSANAAEAAEHWKAAADQAAAKVFQMESRELSSAASAATFASPQLEQTQKELEEKLAAAERALSGVQKESSPQPRPKASSSKKGKKHK